MKRVALIGLILLLAAALVWLGIYWQPEDTVSSEIAPVPQGGDFVLASADGPVKLAAMRGKVVVLFFGYTTCPDVCPTSLGMLSMALNGLSEGEVEQVQGIFVSVDPGRDSLEHLQKYVKYFHPQIHGVTGTPEQVLAVTEMYGAAYHKSLQDESYLIDHTADLYLVDQAGKLHSRIRHGTPADEMMRQLRQLLNRDR
ncbi:MAG: SCO family protein [Gammaproteobacteria bacterium]|nr:SCO family protein [Gammaproteobacteria bacterium]